MDFDYSKINNLRVLLVGGTGFIGRYILQKLIQHNAKVSILALFREGEYNGELLNRCEFLLKGEVFDTDVQNKIREQKWDCVINCGGYINQNLDKESEEEMFRAHFETVRVLVNLVGNNIKRFIQTGSAVEYGNNPIPHREDMREMPLNPYAAAKVAATHYLQMRYRTYGFPVVILRPFFVYGEGQDNKKLIPYIIEKAKRNEDIILNNPDSIRDPIHVEDVAEAYIRALIVDGIDGEIINIGSGKGYTVRDISEMIIKKIGKGRIKIQTRSNRCSDMKQSVADNKKLLYMLLFSTFRMFDNFLEELDC
ncbi:MAG: NAD-dependent epimerase/dehydratase family protein [Myxococcota bacterium]